jgi:hypothetical protein
MMPPKKKTARILPSKVVHPEPRAKAPPADGALDHNSFNDTNNDTLTHRIAQTTNPGFAKTLTDEAANAEANVMGFKGMSMQDIGRPTGFAALQGAQAEAFAANTTTTDLLPQSLQQVPPPSQANQDHMDLEQEIESSRNSNKSMKMKPLWLKN